MDSVINQIMEYQLIRILGSVKNILNFYFEKREHMLLYI